LLEEKKLSLEAEVNQGNENSGAENNNGESEGSNSRNDNGENSEPPTNDTNSLLQTAKNNAIREIKNALYQEPKLTTIHDLSEDNRD